jgi:hypothetical protein
MVPPPSSSVSTPGIPNHEPSLRPWRGLGCDAILGHGDVAWSTVRTAAALWPRRPLRVLQCGGGNHRAPPHATGRASSGRTRRVAVRPALALCAVAIPAGPA